MFFENLSEACKKNNTSVTRTITSLGISRSNVTNWKNGTMPSGDIIVRLSELLNVTTDYLLTGKETVPTTYPENIQRIIDNLLELNDEALAILYGETRVFCLDEKYTKQNKNKNVG